MASTQLGTTTVGGNRALGGQVCLEKAGNRLYAIYEEGVTGLLLKYSDDSGVTWSAGTTVSVLTQTVGAMVYDSTTGRLEIYYGGTNGATEALRHRAISSNVTTGVPGALSTEISVDAGGSNSGVEWISCCISPTVSNPRIWIIGEKWTSATNREVRIWWCATGVSTDTGANYGSATNVGTTNSTNPTSMGRIMYQKIATADRVFAVFGDASVTPNRLKCIVFDPTTATPSTAISGATVNNFAPVGSGSYDNWENEGPHVWAASLDDYIVVGRRDPSTGKVDWFYSTNGTSFTAVTSGSITSGRASVSTDGTDFHIVHADTYGVLASTNQTMSYRKLTKSSNTLGGATVFSDGSGNQITVPRNTGTSTLFALYGRGTASPWNVRSDTVSILSDTTAPGTATSFTGTAVSGTQINLSAVMPSDPDTAFYEIHRLSGSTYPASDRSDGTTIVASTATTAGSTVTFSDTGLTGSTTYSYRIFVRDAAGNWNTGATLQVTARTKPSLSQRYKADATTTVADGVTAAGEAPVLEFAALATDFNGTAVAHIRARVGTDNATPPTLNTFDVFSGSGGSNWRYEDPAASGTFVNWPATGLPTAKQTARKIRLYTPATFVGQLYVSWRIEQ